MVKRKRAGLVKLNNLPLLQNLIRRDPPSYQEEFLLQYRHYESQRDIFMSTPSSSSTSTDASNAEKFADLVGFMSQVANCYPQYTKTFPEDLGSLLLNNHATLHPDLREKLVQSLVLLRNKDVISSPDLLKTLFPILTVTKAKALRAQIYTTIIAEMRNANAKTKNHKLNKTVQAVLFGLVETGKDDPLSTVGLWAVKITRELWKRNVWDDARAVEIMKEAALSRNHKVMVGGARFFLGVDQEKEEVLEGDSDDDGLGSYVEKLRKGAGISKTAKKKRQLEKAVSVLKRKERAKHKPHPLNFSALHLLRDPQGFIEQLYSMHLSPKNTKLSLENKLVVLQLVTRLIGLHKLELLPIYSYILKYLTPRQREVTHFLACTAQASHDLVPPDVLEPLVKKVADEFVSDGVASEVATAGLNAIREICARAPLAMTTTLLQDLTEYKGSNDKGVMMAARSLIGLYREIAPEMLKKKDRGKVAVMDIKKTGGPRLRFGEEKSGVIEGLDLLEEWKEQQRKLKNGEAGEENGEGTDEGDNEDGWEGWEVEDDEDSDNEGWTNVESDDEIVLSDTEDEKPVKRPKLAKAMKGKVKEDEEEKEEEEKEEAEKEEKETEEQKTAEEIREEEKRINKLAMTRILTPADFAKLAELRTQAALDKQLGKKRKNAETTRTTNEDAITSDIIAHTHAPAKSNKEERMAKVLAGREDREKFGSRKHKALDEKPHSSTNREKARKKNFLMTLVGAKRKQRMGLVEVRKGLVGKRSSSRERRGNRYIQTID
ncbi:SDA1-domain-containing protein [Kalaharituber pfeilii]|nr:SDA1-domain-containing protein [Kalaharituber pfeilii]